MSQRQESITTFKTVVIRDAITRPANTTAYTAGDVIAEVTTNDHLLFSEVVRKGPNHGSGMITNAIIRSSANQGTKLDAELWLFSVDMTEVADNAAFAPTDAELLTLVGVIDFPVASWKAGAATAGAGGNAVCLVENIGIAFRTTENLYGVLVARNAYTPVASEIFTVDLVIAQD